MLEEALRTMVLPDDDTSGINEPSSMRKADSSEYIGLDSRANSDPSSGSGLGRVAQSDFASIQSRIAFMYPPDPPPRMMQEAAASSGPVSAAPSPRDQPGARAEPRADAHFSSLLAGRTEGDLDITDIRNKIEACSQSTKPVKPVDQSGPRAKDKPPRGAPGSPKASKASKASKPPAAPSPSRLTRRMNEARRETAKLKRRTNDMTRKLTTLERKNAEKDTQIALLESRLRRSEAKNNQMLVHLSQRTAQPVERSKSKPSSSPLHRVEKEVRMLTVQKLAQEEELTSQARELRQLKRALEEARTKNRSLRKRMSHDHKQADGSATAATAVSSSPDSNSGQIQNASPSPSSPIPLSRKRDHGGRMVSVATSSSSMPLATHQRQRPLSRRDRGVGEGVIVAQTLLSSPGANLISFCNGLDSLVAALRQPNERRVQSSGPQHRVQLPADYRQAAAASLEMCRRNVSEDVGLLLSGEREPTALLLPLWRVLDCATHILVNAGAIEDDGKGAHGDGIAPRVRAVVCSLLFIIEALIDTSEACRAAVALPDGRSRERAHRKGQRLPKGYKIHPLLAAGSARETGDLLSRGFGAGRRGAGDTAPIVSPRILVPSRAGRRRDEPPVRISQSPPRNRGSPDFVPLLLRVLKSDTTDAARVEPCLRLLIAIADRSSAAALARLDVLWAQNMVWRLVVLDTAGLENKTLFITLLRCLLRAPRSATRLQEPLRAASARGGSYGSIVDILLSFLTTRRAAGTGRKGRRLRLAAVRFLAGVLAMHGVEALTGGGGAGYPVRQVLPRLVPLLDSELRALNPGPTASEPKHELALLLVQEVFMLIYALIPRCDLAEQVSGVRQLFLSVTTSFIHEKIHPALRILVDPALNLRKILINSGSLDLRQDDHMQDDDAAQNEADG